MHLVRAIALDSNPPLNVWSVFTYWYCKSYYQYCLTKIRSSLYFTKQLEEDGRQRGEAERSKKHELGVSFLLWVTHSMVFHLSYANELCGTAKSSSQLWCFLTFELVSDKKNCDIIEIEDAQNRIFCYNNTLQSSWGMRRSDEEKKKTNKPGWHNFVGEWGIWWLQYRRHLGCHFRVSKCQLLRATPTSAAVPIQKLCRCQSSLLWIDKIFTKDKEEEEEEEENATTPTQEKKDF